jgi:hypothetical protein
MARIQIRSLSLYIVGSVGAGAGAGVGWWVQVQVCGSMFPGVRVCAFEILFFPIQALLPQLPAFNAHSLRCLGLGSRVKP